MTELSSLGLSVILGAVALGLLLSYSWFYRKTAAMPRYRRWIVYGVVLALATPAFILSWIPSGYASGYIFGFLSVLKWPMSLGFLVFVFLSGVSMAIMIILGTSAVKMLLPTTQASSS